MHGEDSLTARAALATGSGDAEPRTDGWSRFEALYEEIGNSVFRLLLRMTGSRETAADLTHDAFVRAYERFDQFERSGRLHAWVYRIASNLARDWRKRPRRFVDDAPREDALRPDDRISDDRAALRMTLHGAVGRLPESQRLVLLLYDVDGFTHEEIAEMLDVAVGTSKARLSRAREALRHAIGSKARGHGGNED